MLRFNFIFKDEYKYVKEIYQEFINTTSAGNINDKILLLLLEIGTRFGERLGELKAKNYIEIGCGLAIPSFTLVKLGHKAVTAIDIDPGVMAFTEKIKIHLQCELNLKCFDIFKTRPEIKKGDLLIAEKPASYKKNTLEVEYNIANWCKIEGYNFALIPSFLKTDNVRSYIERCVKYEKKYKQSGYKVENKQICEELPLRWLIAEKRHY